MRPLLIGQAPSRIGDPAAPLAGRIGGRLARLCGMDPPMFLRATERINLLPACPAGPARGKGDPFPAPPARAAALQLIPRLAGRRVVFVGVATARAFAFPGPLLTWKDHVGASCAVLPHPSGVNFWWNDPVNRAAAERFARTLFRP
jgi:hypothetical protein